MKTRVLTFIATLVLLLNTSCGLIGDKIIEVEAPSLICQYTRYNESNFSIFDVFTDSIYYIYPIFTGGQGSFSYTFLDEDKNRKERYNELCQKHNDIDYKHKVMVINDHIIMSNVYVDFSPVKIDITSTNDFDEEHPAGTSLADLFYFRSFTPYPFIKQGYTGKKYTLINKQLNQLNTEDLTLSLHFNNSSAQNDEIRQLLGKNLLPQIILLKENYPTLKQEHELTISLINSKGKGYTCTCNVNFKESTL